MTISYIYIGFLVEMNEKIIIKWKRKRVNDSIYRCQELPSSSNKERSKLPWGLQETETATLPRGREFGKGWEIGLQESHEDEVVGFGKGESGSNLMVVDVVPIISCRQNKAEQKRLIQFLSTIQYPHSGLTFSQYILSASSKLIFGPFKKNKKR